MNDRRRWTQRVTLAMIALCFSLAIGILTFGFFSRAQEKGQETHDKYFTSIMILPGDTLYSIAFRYYDSRFASVEDYVKEVAAINHLQNIDVIYAGEYLIVPYYNTQP